MAGVLRRLLRWQIIVVIFRYSSRKNGMAMPWWWWWCGAVGGVVLPTKWFGFAAMRIVWLGMGERGGDMVNVSRLWCKFRKEDSLDRECWGCLGSGETYGTHFNRFNACRCVWCKQLRIRILGTANWALYHLCSSWVFYLLFLSAFYTRYITMSNEYHPQITDHIIGGVSVIEILSIASQFITSISSFNIFNALKMYYGNLFRYLNDPMGCSFQCWNVIKPPQPSRLIKSHSYCLLPQILPLLHNLMSLIFNIFPSG